MDAVALAFTSAALFGAMPVAVRFALGPPLVPAAVGALLMQTATFLVLCVAAAVQGGLTLHGLLPFLVAGAIATAALFRLSPALTTLFPGLWSLLYGVAIFSARPYVPRASGWVALYFWTAGLLLLWTAGGIDTLSPWSVGGTFGIGQLFGAVVLYWNLERGEVK